jgi:aminoglycoside phosphotransferase family enzyme
MPSQPEGVSTPVAVEVKVAFLQRPDAYAELPNRVETVETHMSWVFLADGYAYKLKKPVRYDFLDFSTLDARRRDSEEEVRLNRRLAPDVYLGTVPLVLDARGQLRLGGPGEIVDWLVRMRRLPAERMLDHGIRRRTVAEADVVRVAEALARFYLSAPPVELAPADYRKRLAERVDDNLRELAAPVFGLPPQVVRAVSSAQLALIEREPGMFDRRVEEKRIIEGHGDLRPEHVCLEPALFIDCLEFQRDYRILDAADEVAFLALECERLGGTWVGDVLFRTYGEITGDCPPERLVRFYKSYRACLRAKIAIWHLKDAGMPNPERWSRRAMEYLGLAERYAQGL